MNALIDFSMLEFLCLLKYRKSEHLLVITMHSGTTRETVSGVREAYIAESGIELCDGLPGEVHDPILDSCAKTLPHS